MTDIDVDRIHCRDGVVVSVGAKDATGRHRDFDGDYFSQQCLFRSLFAPWMLRAGEVKEISEGLQYRDFITVGLLASKLSVHDKQSPIC